MPSLAAPTGGTTPWTGFARLFGGAALAALALGAALSLWADPYWIHRDRPPWLAWTGGVSRALDLEMRRAKPLQLTARPAEAVLVGSSTVYRGIDPAGWPCPGERAYNLGLSSLMAEELPTLARLVAGREGVRAVVIGLDYFQFSAFRGPPPVDPALATGPGARALARLRAVVSLRALAGAALAGRAYEPGAWRADGFKTTPPYPPEVTRRIDAEQALHPYRPQAVEALRAALDVLRGLRVTVYLSPVSDAWSRRARAAGLAGDVARFRADAALAAREAGAVFLDLAEAHPAPAFDPDAGSSGNWLDTLHFGPALGRWVMGRAARCAAR